MHHLCPPLLVHFLLGTPSVCCPFPTQPGHPAVRPYLSKMFCRKYTLFARLPLSNSSLCWIVGFCCVLLAVAFHGLPNTQIQELQIPIIITFQTSHKSCLHCTCWRLLQKFISAVKLAEKNSSHPPHVQLGSIVRMVSPHAHFSKWHNFSGVVLAPDGTRRRSSGSLHLKVVHNPCRTIQPGPTSWRRLLEMPEAVPELSNSLPPPAPGSLSGLLALQSRSELWIDTV